jgi:NADH-quinone oxidoreductase subunit G
LISKLKAKLGAISDSVERTGDADKLLVSADKNPNTNGARLTGICFSEMGINLPKIADGIAKGAIKTLIVFGEDVTKHGIMRYFPVYCAFQFAWPNANGLNSLRVL